MNQKPQEKLEVSSDVIEQLNTMARNGTATRTYGPEQVPGPGPAPAPHNQRDAG